MSFRFLSRTLSAKLNTIIYKHLGIASLPSFESVLILSAKFFLIRISPCLSKPQLTEVAARHRVEYYDSVR